MHINASYDLNLTNIIHFKINWLERFCEISLKKMKKPIYSY